MRTRMTPLGLSFCCLCAASGALWAAPGVPVLIEAEPSAGQVSVALSWFAEPDATYTVHSTTNLRHGAFTPLAGAPIVPPSLVGEFRVGATDAARYFKVQPLDDAGPEIVSRYPSTNGVGVGRMATLSVTVRDPAGIDTNAFSLSVNGAPLLSNASPGVRVSTNAFLYTPPATAWGSFDETVAVAFVCADLLGNVATSRWSFVLEVLPVVTTDEMVQLRPPAVGAPSHARALLAETAERHGVRFSDDLAVVSITTNAVLLRYSGVTHGLSSGAVLINHDPAAFFYRRILSLSDDPTNRLVAVGTAELALTDLVKEGSFSPELLVSAAGGAQAATWDVELGYSLPFTYQDVFSVPPIDLGPNMRFTPGELTCDLRGALQVSCVIRNWELVAFDSGISTEFAAQLRTRFEVMAQADLLDETVTLASVPLGYVVAFIGIVPVWVELQVAVDLGVELGAEGALVVETGLDALASNSFRLEWRAETGITPVYTSELRVEWVPISAGFQVSAEAYAYVKPRLSALLYSLAGVSADYRRGLSLGASYTSGDPQCAITLSDKWSLNVGFWALGVDDLPTMTLIDGTTPLATWYFPDIADHAPVFSRQPVNASAPSGADVLLHASATGLPEPTYQWYQDGRELPFQNQPLLAFAASTQSTGAFHVVAANRMGQATSVTATVALSQPPQPGPGDYLVVDLSAGPNAAAYPVSHLSAVPAGGWSDEYRLTKLVLRRISSGVFAMGSPAGELGRGSDESRHQVTLTQDFYLGVFEVTQAQWERVMGTWPSWFVNASHRATRPVESVSYGDIRGSSADVRWPTNSSVDVDSFMGRLRARTGRAFDLPTEAQWEYAGRAGTTTALNSGTNLTREGNCPNMIQVGRYWYNGGSSAARNADTSVGTAKVGAYLANGWGLYDMHGNVLEWCLDWYETYTGAVSDPRGPLQGSYRVQRGGSWDDFASYCRSAARNYESPGYAHGRTGFRVAVQPGLAADP